MSSLSFIFKRLRWKVTGVRKISNLEIHLVHACNLACESCSHYSNQGHKGILSLADAERWMRLWNHRLNPGNFAMLGGEPTIHPDLAEFVPLARRYWPRAHLKIVTNGFFLQRHPLLPIVLKKDRDACLHVTIHSDASEYREKIRPVLELVNGWVRDHQIRVVYVESYKNWTRRYRGFGSAMEPFEDGQPRFSWEHCAPRHCTQLLEGKLWKCSPLAYLPMQDARHCLSAKWKPYLQYQPLKPGCTDRQLEEFFDREDEVYCGMCPVSPERFDLPLPLKTMVPPSFS